MLQIKLTVQLIFNICQKTDSTCSSSHVSAAMNLIHGLTAPHSPWSGSKRNFRRISHYLVHQGDGWGVKNYLRRRMDGRQTETGMILQRVPTICKLWATYCILCIRQIFQWSHGWYCRGSRAGLKPTSSASPPLVSHRSGLSHHGYLLPETVP